MARTSILRHELRRLANRGIDRVFKTVQGRGPLRLIALFEIVDRVCPELWAGDENSKIEAIKVTIRRAADLLAKLPVHSETQVSMRDAVLRLYDIASVAPELEQQHATNKSRYETLRRIFIAEVDWQAHHGSLEKKTGQIRHELAKALEALVDQPPSTRSAAILGLLKTKLQRPAVKLSIALAVAMVLVIGVAATIVATRDDAGQSRVGGVGSSSDPYGGQTSASSPTNQPGALTLTLVDQGNRDVSVVFPRDKTAEAASFVNETNFDALAADLEQRAYRAGAYPSGQVTLTIAVQTKLDTEIIIHDIRIVERVDGSPLDGPLISLEASQGTAKNQMTFLLARTPTVAMTSNDHEQVSSIPFFDLQTINVTPKGGQTIDIGVQAAKAATTFRIAFDYVIDGKLFTQIFDQGGQPFRVASPACRISAYVGPEDTDMYGRHTRAKNFGPRIFEGSECRSP